MITRRRVLWGMAAGVGVLGFGVGVLGRTGTEAEIVSIIRRRLDYLKLDPDGVRQFAKDAVTAALARKIPTMNRLRYHFLAAVAPSFNRYHRSTDSRGRIVKLEDMLVSNYLLSSDFFIEHADESRVVNYLAYYDPQRACGNPFARPAVDAPGAAAPGAAAPGAA